MHGPSEKRALRNRCFRTFHVRSGLSHGQTRISVPQKRKKLLCPLVNPQCCKASFFCRILNQGYNLIGKLDLS